MGAVFRFVSGTFVLLGVYQQFAVSDICRIELPASSDNASTLAEVDTSKLNNNEFIECPRSGDPPEFTACCFYKMHANSTAREHTFPITVNGTPTCCPPDEEPILFYFISDQLALLIAVSVTTILLIITVIVIVCCFWSRCPLYMMCRVRYRQDDIIAYASKEDETTNLNDMPPEEQKGVTIYSPNAVKVTMKDDL